MQRLNTLSLKQVHFLRRCVIAVSVISCAMQRLFKPEAPHPPKAGGQIRPTVSEM